MDMQLAQPLSIHLVSVRPSEPAGEGRLVRGIVYAVAIQSAAVLAIVGSWLLIKS
jgi:hypothetical protein